MIGKPDYYAIVAFEVGTQTVEMPDVVGPFRENMAAQHWTNAVRGTIIKNPQIVHARVEILTADAVIARGRKTPELCRPSADVFAADCIARAALAAAREDED